jgi:hypothetical protein
MIPMMRLAPKLPLGEKGDVLVSQQNLNVSFSFLFSSENWRNPRLAPLPLNLAVE